MPKHCGCTAAVALVASAAGGGGDGGEAVRARRVHVANAGDARVVLVSRDGTGRRLTRDHKVEDADEAQRIKDMGGFIQNGRVAGTKKRRLKKKQAMLKEERAKND